MHLFSISFIYNLYVASKKALQLEAIYLALDIGEYVLRGTLMATVTPLGALVISIIFKVVKIVIKKIIENRKPRKSLEKPKPTKSIQTGQSNDSILSSVKRMTKTGAGKTSN